MELEEARQVVKVPVDESAGWERMDDESLSDWMVVQLINRDTMSVIIILTEGPNLLGEISVKLQERGFRDYELPLNGLHEVPDAIEAMMFLENRRDREL